MWEWIKNACKKLGHVAIYGAAPGVGAASFTKIVLQASLKEKESETISVENITALAVGSVVLLYASFRAWNDLKAAEEQVKKAEAQRIKENEEAEEQKLALRTQIDVLSRLVNKAANTFKEMGKQHIAKALTDPLTITMRTIDLISPVKQRGTHSSPSTPFVSPEAPLIRNEALSPAREASSQQYATPSSGSEKSSRSSSRYAPPTPARLFTPSASATSTPVVVPPLFAPATPPLAAGGVSLQPVGVVHRQTSVGSDETDEKELLQDLEDVHISPRKPA